MSDTSIVSLRILLIPALAVVLSAACGRPATPGQREPAATESKAHQPALHGRHDAVPGSYEDWCGEHQVPESQCSRCNPALIPAFKATNDWCAEHRLPESQCLRCNPDLEIIRPPREAPKQP